MIDNPTGDGYCVDGCLITPPNCLAKDPSDKDKYNWIKSNSDGKIDFGSKHDADKFCNNFFTQNKCSSGGYCRAESTTDIHIACKANKANK